MIKINPEDLHIEIYGPVDSRNKYMHGISNYSITHKPTGIVAECRRGCEDHHPEEEVIDARKCAMKKLRGKLKDAY